MISSKMGHQLDTEKKNTTRKTNSDSLLSQHRILQIAHSFPQATDLTKCKNVNIFLSQFKEH